MNVIGLLTVFMAANTWLGLIFDLNSLPFETKQILANLTTLDTTAPTTASN